VNDRIVFTDPGTVAIESEPRPEPGPSDVLIETERTLVSTGTELTILTEDYAPGSPLSQDFPHRPGYNNVGRVVETGADVQDLSVGDRVATYGDHAQFVTERASACREVPDAVDSDAAVYFTIAEIVANGLRRGRLAWGETVAVYGLGLLGQLTVRLARFAGAGAVVGLDVAEDRIDFLPEGAAVAGVDPTAEGWRERFDAATGGRSADVVFEVTGNQDAIDGEFDVLRDLGRLVVLSSPRGPTNLDLNARCHNPGYEIIGAHNHTHPNTETPHTPWTQHRHAEVFFDALAQDRLAVADLTSHRRHYTDAPEVYDTLVTDRTQALGVVFEW
jgi:2-desacetyl-2-hydroxyethyl bacteriochlorophyllide A dehydrogenase